MGATVKPRPMSTTGRWKVVRTVTVLLAGLGSISLDATMAVLVSIAEFIPGGMRADEGATTTVTVATAPVERFPRLPKTVVAFVITSPWEEMAETKVTPAGNTLVNATELAESGPKLATKKV